MPSAILLSLLATIHPGISHWHGRQVAQTTLCFKSGEQSGGMTKICYYNCLGSTVAVTIGATELCPLTINR